MQPHQQRVVDELKDLEDKIRKLTDFILSDKFTAIVPNQDERDRMIIQNAQMNAYANTLLERINNFN